MILINPRNKYRVLLFLRHDLKASITVFFVALPLCLGISLASGAPAHAGLWAGIVGGMLVPMISRSALSVSGPATGLTAICAFAIAQLGTLEAFYFAVVLAGVLQVFLGLFKLGGFTHLIPSSVIKGMLTAIGIILIGKQIPLIVGYDQPDFWEEELFNLLTFSHGFEHIKGLREKISAGATSIAVCSFVFMLFWEKKMVGRTSYLPSSFITVIIGATLALLLHQYLPSYSLKPSQLVLLPQEREFALSIPQYTTLFSNTAIWESAVVICLVASLESLLSTEAVDKIDPQNRVTPQNRELFAQGIGNIASGLIGGIPITSVIVRSAANVEAGGRTRASAFMHGVWLLLTVLFAVSIVNYIPYCVLAVILLYTGYRLARPSLIKAVYRQGREQFMPFAVTIIAILLTNLLIGVLIGIGFAILQFIFLSGIRTALAIRYQKRWKATQGITRLTWH